MTDLEKVVRGLEGMHRCISPVNHSCGDCPYQDNHVECERRVINDAITLLKEQQETITSLQGTICKLNAALAEQPKQKFFVDFDGKITPLPKQKHGNWIPIKSPTGVEYGGFKEYTVQEVMCSECGFTDDVSASIYTYCPECGAKMDEGVEQDD